MIEDDARSGGAGADYGGPQAAPQPAELIAASLFGRVARTRTRSALAARGRLVTSPQRQVPPVAKRSLPVGTEPSADSAFPASVDRGGAVGAPFTNFLPPR